MNCQPRILWSIGQTLLPEHMRGMEDSILSDSAMRAGLTGLPYYGFSDLQFGKALQTDGLLTLERGTIVTKSGRLFSVGSNATINTLNLNTSGKSNVPVYLHVLEPETREKSNRESQLLHYDIMPTWKWRLYLSFEDDFNGTLEYLQFAVVEKDIRSEWILSKNYMPPLIKLGGSGFFYEDLVDLDAVLVKYLKILGEESADIQLSGENLINVKNCIIEVRLFKQVVSSVLGEIHLHPWLFLERLERFYLIVCNYQGVDPVLYGRKYQHDNLAGCLSELIQAVKNLLEKSRNATPMIEFRASAGVYCLSMADSTANAVNWFLLVQKPSVQLSIDMSSVKLAALPRLSIIHKYFLPGVGLRKVDRPIFQHYFGPEIDMYEIMKGEEWTQSINDRSLAFLQEKRFEGLRFFLYWSQV